MRTFEALIVGGGPAGSTCARRLRAAGMDVAVIDKCAFPRDKTCAGWITPAVIGELELDVSDYRASRVLQPIHGFRTGIMGRRVVETHYDRPVSYGIRRCEFDHYLLQRCGAELYLNERVRSIERDDGDWIVNGALRSPLLIGAGGHACPVARQVSSASPGRERAVVAQEIEFRMDAQQLARCAVDARVPELYFCPDLKGYAWCFRKGEYLNIGLGREDEQHLTEHVAAFVAMLRQEGRIPPGSPEKFHGHAYILHGHSPRRPSADGALLVGDAAGLAYPESGEGIRPAVESGILAATAVVDACGDYSAASLRRYDELLVHRLGRGRAAIGASSRLVTTFKQSAAAWLMSTSWFTRRMVIERWFLHMHQPTLDVRAA